MFSHLLADIKTVFRHDPAVKSWLEVLICYPGVHALSCYRLAHWLYLRKRYILARFISQFARFCTGIEIHPGADIGKNMFIDHGTGIVIGETAEIGEDVVLFQGVTLGGTGKDVGKRHPTIGNRVFISAGASVLGPVTVGDDVKIGAGAVVLQDVPPNTTVVGVPARVVKQNGVHLKNPAKNNNEYLVNEMERSFQFLSQRIIELEKRIEELESENKAIRKYI